MRLFRSLSFRLALTYAALFCLSAGALFGIAYWLNIQRPLDRVKARVELEMRELSQVYIVEGEAALRTALARRGVRNDVNQPFHAFLAADGTAITANLPSWPKTVSPGWIEIEADRYRDGDETDHDALLLDRRFRDGRRLLVGRDVEEISDLTESLSETAAWIISCALVLGIAGGVMMSLAINRRIDSVNRAARTVIAGDLSGRVPVRGTGDDFDQLGETLNVMLARIEELFESVRRVSDSVAHELRTPLTRLLARLEQIEATGDAVRKDAVIDAAIDEAKRLHVIFDALLRISRIETGRHHKAMRQVDVSVLIEDVVEFHQPEADRRGLRLEAAVAPGLGGHGDPDLLFQALSNLIDNAVKYSSAGGTIRVSGTRDGPRLLLAVRDDGPGIDPDEIGRVTERFYRAAAAGKRPGEGLGLSLVAAVVGYHGGSLRLVNGHPGIHAEIEINSI